MQPVWIILGAVLVVLAAQGFNYNYKTGGRGVRRTLRKGEHTLGWLIQANNGLFKPDISNLPALIVLSPDRATTENERWMLAIADRVYRLKGVDPQSCRDAADAEVAKLMSSDIHCEGRRTELPREFTEGKSVYLAHIEVIRIHLPNKILKTRRIPCAIIWDNEQSPICTRPFAGAS